MTERPIEQLIAGNAFRDTLVPKAEQRYLPELLWHGWAIMDGFLAGVDWRMETETREECGMSFGPFNLRVLQASGASNILGAYEAVRDLHAKAKALVDMLDDAERNHGALIGSKTLTAANELRLELSRWK